MGAAETLERGRRAFEDRAWSDAYAHLSAADEAGSLEAEDLERLAGAAYLTGRDPESEEVWTRAHHLFLTRGEMRRACRCAFWLGLQLMNKGERARAGGWLARGSRFLDEAGGECVETGYFLIPAAIRRVVDGDPVGGHDTFREAADIGERFGDWDLVTFALHGQGRALIRMGEIERGLSLLDEAMAAVEAGGLSPVIAGDVYCSLIEACHELFDLRRAREWTAALTRWCEAQPQLVPFRGQCLVRRAELFRLEGAWPQALDEARQACEQLTRPPGEPAAGAAYYQVGELLRVRGELEDAEKAYGEASRWGRTPQPGLALLRLGQGRADAAAGAIRTALEEARAPAPRSRLLPAAVEILLAVDDVEAARAGADELEGIAGKLDTPLLWAEAARARGALLLAEGDPRGACEPLRQARSVWQELDAPYEVARARTLLAEAHRALGDDDGAELELKAARQTFEELGAAPDRARLGGSGRTVSGTGRSHGLTRRELEVLRLVANGRTNREIAGKLYISERTVERHVSNILGKLRVRSRAAATSYAYEHHLV